MTSKSEHVLEIKEVDSNKYKSNQRGQFKTQIQGVKNKSLNTITQSPVDKIDCPIMIIAVLTLQISNKLCVEKHVSLF